MKAKIFCLFFLIVLEFIVCPQNGWTQDNTIPMIGAYYFDGWSGKNNSQELWAQEAPTHLTEKLYNDYNERQPETADQSRSCHRHSDDRTVCMICIHFLRRCKECKYISPAGRHDSDFRNISS